MWDLGQFALRLALFLSSYAILIDLLGLWRKRGELLVSGRNATIGCLLCLTISTVVLWILLLQGEFAVSYVASHTSRALPTVYKFTALWAGAAGSLLFWLWLQVGFVVLAFAMPGGKDERFSAAARAAANLVTVFFMLVLLFDRDPFELLAVTPRDGMGMNPLLQHPAMALHPPTLFVGYAAFAVPYAWAMAAMKQGDPSKAALRFARARNWSLFAWVFLTLGIALGAWWAYEELGWGGYWAWDPVENSSLMPWLTATALVHCARVYRSGTPIAAWFLVLAVLTFSLCVFGTFLTRYGLVSSIHAFPEPGLGLLFIVLLAHIGVIASILFVRWYRRPGSMAVTQGQGLRVIVWNNWIMLLLTFVIFVGTLFPFFTGLVSSHQISLKPDYFTKITAPAGLILLLLTGICPHLIRHGFVKNWRIVGTAVTALIAVAIWAFAGSLAIAFLVACAFVGVSLTADFVQRYVRPGPGAESRSLRASLRWYGARIVHIGVLLSFIGIAGSGGFGTEEQVALRPGQRIEAGEFELVYDGLRLEPGPNFTAVVADMFVYREGERIDTLSPAIRFFELSDRRTSDVAIRRTLAKDLYLALTQVDNSTNLINLTIFIKPLVNWLWIGNVALVLGASLAIASVVGRRRNAPQAEGVEE